MEVIARVDLGSPVHFKAAEIQFVQSPGSCWKGKISLGRSGEFVSQVGESPIIFYTKTAILWLSDVCFEIGGLLLFEIRFPLFRDSFILIEGVRVNFSYRAYMEGQTCFDGRIEIVRFFEEKSGSVRVFSDSQDAEVLLAIGLASIVYELMASERG